MPIKNPKHPSFYISLNQVILPLLRLLNILHIQLTMTPPGELRKHACTICARRKVKCDKQDPCSNCQKAQTQCSYEAPPPPKQRKRAADEELLAKLAQYEDLMQKNGIDYSQHANVWVSSGLEAKAERDTSTDTDSPAPTELCLWSTLCPELKYPPMIILRHKEDPFLHPSPPFTSILDTTIETYNLHPEAKHIYFLWQTFVETVNPLVKIVHVPTLQKRILDASWDPSLIEKPLSALMFSIYTLSVTSLTPENCQSFLGQDRGALLDRYRIATMRVLAEANYMETKEFEVLQAMTLFIFSNPESAIASNLTAVAIRTGQMMGLHKIDSDTKLSFFEKEMRVRLWWQIKGLDSRVRAVSTPGIKLSKSDFGDLRPPLNINDADLHPDMLEPPVEHTGPTEMICVMMKYEVTSWIKSSPRAAKLFENIPGFAKGKASTRCEYEAVNELEAIYTEKYLSKLDRCVPFHDLTYIMANLALARMRFMLHHPRGRSVSGEDVYVTRLESDLIFNAALSFIQYVDAGFKSKFSSQMFTHLTSTYHIDAYVYVISELRKRDSGPRIDLAWKLVDGLYNDHHELIDNVEIPLFVALGNLVLEAWETRRKVLTEADVIPSCIELLWAKRRVANAAAEVTADGVNGLEGWEFSVEDFDWSQWNNFMRF
ncbi:transcription factor [Fusarium longipes]|uniref:Transcription factor n=1 Tax=Fusarium longipes TaxID=694270 RepID=A0A395T931_9HYPO|nr:transcription factor [Fusarium longipes]